MFVDKVKIVVHAGDGGDGAVSFRHEKFIEKGGPDGGDGGDGGNVILRASRNQDTLASFRYQRLVTAESGSAGQKRKRHGKSGQDLMIDVPVGTVASNEDGEVIADLVHDNQEITVAQGGKGGFGNAHFVSSVRQAPRVAEKGEKGDQKELLLEIKMIADVGLIGLPNAGKSTLLARTSNAKPEIANYPFTTLTPNLGVVDMYKETALLFADIPGLIEGASKGKGLGDEFLRHVERTSVLIHVIDVYESDIAKAFQIIQEELAAYSKELAARPKVIALNKIDGVDKDIVDDQIKTLKKVAKKIEILPISASSGVGIKELLNAVAVHVKKSREIRHEAQEEVDNAIPVLRYQQPDEAWTITESNKRLVVEGTKIERFARRTDFANPHGVQRLRDIMRKMGILHELNRRNIEPGEKIIIGKDNIGSIEY